MSTSASTPYGQSSRDEAAGAPPDVRRTTSTASLSPSPLKRRPDSEVSWSPNKNQKTVQYSKEDRERRKEVELTDLEKGMKPYTWQDPLFPVAAAVPRIVYIDSANDPSLDSLLSELVERPIDTASDYPISLGFDMEWKYEPLYDRTGRTALIQICSRSLVLLLHIAYMVPSSGRGNPLPVLPPALEAVLRRSDVLKTGVKVEGDAKKLRGEFRQSEQDSAPRAVSSGAQGITSNGLLELSYLARRTDPERWGSMANCKWLISLRELAAVYLGRKLVKDESRTSDWSQQKLSEQQIKYAASDVMVGLEIYEAIRRRAMLQADGVTVIPLTERRDCSVIEREQRLAKVEVLKNARKRLSTPSASQSAGSGSSQETCIASDDAGVSDSQRTLVGTEESTTNSQPADSQPVESQDSQATDVDQPASQMSTQDDLSIAGDSQSFPSDTQIGSSQDLAAADSRKFLEAVRLSTSNLTRRSYVISQPAKKAPAVAEAQA
ncbi:hypothetical protein CF326_g1280 [Tilletia indica]|nr:hypothetical protein CF326_g1280 [Tilletia indica]